MKMTELEDIFEEIRCKTDFAEAAYLNDYFASAKQAMEDVIKLVEKAINLLEKEQKEGSV